MIRYRHGHRTCTDPCRRTAGKARAGCSGTGYRSPAAARFPATDCERARRCRSSCGTHFLLGLGIGDLARFDPRSSLGIGRHRLDVAAGPLAELLEVFVLVPAVAIAALAGDVDELRVEPLPLGQAPGLPLDA